MTPQDRAWTPVAIFSFVLILVVVFTWEAAFGAVRTTVSPSPGQAAVNKLVAQLGPKDIVTDIERSRYGVAVHYRRAGCPWTSEPFDVYRGVVWQGYVRSFHYWQYGPWTVASCSTNTRLTWTDWNRPGHRTFQDSGQFTCCYFFKGDAVVSKDQTGNVQYVLRRGRFTGIVNTSEDTDNPNLRVEMRIQQTIRLTASCGNC